jgi:hypothetical protein
MTTALILSAVLFLFASAVALIRAIRQAPEGYETEAGFIMAEAPAPSEEPTHLFPARVARRRTSRAVHWNAPAH